MVARCRQQAGPGTVSRLLPRRPGRATMMHAPHVMPVPVIRRTTHPAALAGAPGNKNWSACAGQRATPRTAQVHKPPHPALYLGGYIYERPSRGGSEGSARGRAIGDGIARTAPCPTAVRARMPGPLSPSTLDICGCRGGRALHAAAAACQLCTKVTLEMRPAPTKQHAGYGASILWRVLSRGADSHPRRRRAPQVWHAALAASATPQASPAMRPLSQRSASAAAHGAGPNGERFMTAASAPGSPYANVPKS